jgi:hypothetical protein
MEKLITLLLDGDQEKAIIEANKLNEGHNLDLIVKDGIEEAMKRWMRDAPRNSTTFLK